MKILGILMIIAGVILGLYIGLWVMFIGGIAGLVNTIFGNSPVEGIDIAFSIVKILFASLVGTIAAFLLIIPGLALTLDK